eukprot:s7092_g2.t1
MSRGRCCDVEICVLPDRPMECSSGCLWLESDAVQLASTPVVRSGRATVHWRMYGFRKKAKKDHSIIALHPVPRHDHATIRANPSKPWRTRIHQQSSFMFAHAAWNHCQPW